VQYALLAGPLLSMVDSSIVNVAAEPIARALHAPLTTVQWTVSGYLLGLGTGLAGTAYLARRYGTVPVYRVSLAAFTAASALCALSPGIGALIAFRVVQGLVAAPLVPLAMSMLLGKGGRARSISVTAGIMLFAAPALGPTVGGALSGRRSGLDRVPEPGAHVPVKRLNSTWLAWSCWPPESPWCCSAPARAERMAGARRRAWRRSWRGPRCWRRTGGTRRGKRSPRSTCRCSGSRCPRCPWACARWPRW
jgi:MFS family permease